MERRILKLLAVLLVAAALAGGAYGLTHHIGGEADSAPEVVVVAPAVPAVSAVPSPTLPPTPTAQPTAEPTPEAVEETAAAPEEVDTAPPASTPDLPSAPPQPQPTLPPPVDPATLEAAVFSGMNAQRAAAGLPPLQLDPALAMVARARAHDMAQNGYFSHVSPAGETFVTLMDRNGVPHSWCGEITAYNNHPDHQTVAVALADWMASQSHRDNILSPCYGRVGVGVAVAGSGMKYFAVVFDGS